jgi:hypothetical protein
MERSAKYLKSLVGAPGFEPGASCAQGRRATRLRYAPTSTTGYSTVSCAIVLKRGDIADPCKQSGSVNGCEFTESAGDRRD